LQVGFGGEVSDEELMANLNEDNFGLLIDRYQRLSIQSPIVSPRMQTRLKAWSGMYSWNLAQGGIIQPGKRELQSMADALRLYPEHKPPRSFGIQEILLECSH